MLPLTLCSFAADIRILAPRNLSASSVTAADGAVTGTPSRTPDEGIVASTASDPGLPVSSLGSR